MDPGLSESLPRCRRPNLADAAILIVAMAACLAIARNTLLPHARYWNQMDLASKSSIGFRLGSLLALVLTVCYFPIRLRGPRPPLSVIRRQPGMVACAAACLSVGFGGLLSLPGVARALSRGSSQPVALIVGASVSNLVVAHAVAGAWLALCLSGAWRSERGWIDAMGRGLGIYWIGSLIFLNCQYLWL